MGTLKLTREPHLHEYDDWRFALYSRTLDAKGDLGAHRLVDAALIAAGVPIERTPPILILDAKDPLVKGLRRMYSKRDYVEGTRLSDQPVGDRWVNAAYLYRVS